MLQLELHQDDSPQDLIAKNIELPIRIGFPRDSNLIARVLHEESFQIFASPEFLATFGTPDNQQSLEAFLRVLLSQTSSSGIVRLKHEEQHISLRPKHTYLVNSPFLLQKMVSSGVGLGVLLPETVKSEIETGQLIRLMPQMHSETLLFSLVYPSRKQLRLRTLTVIAFLPESKLFK